jgi:signal transduction histidine kinase
MIFEVDMIENKLVLSLFDDGTGFDTEKQFSGNGLSNIKKRAAEIEGTLRISTGKSSGTKIVFVGKLKKRFKLFDKN